MIRHTISLGCLLVTISCTAASCTAASCTAAPDKGARAPENVPSSTAQPDTPPAAQQADTTSQADTGQEEAVVAYGFDDDTAMQSLVKKAQNDTATEGELRMLKGICMHRANAPCRDLAVRKLKALKAKK